ncbi:MAG: hypothetical protein KF678_05725 [Phycisphaeraceae bacterium]|nr:hypothetical protein [Phycisphaeraceae bacterium]
MSQPDARKHLIEAMCHLTFGDDRKFCDHLWLGYGDVWRDALIDLARRQLITVKFDGHEEQFAITPRGRAWTQQLATAVHSAA